MKAEPAVEPQAAAKQAVAPELDTKVDEPQLEVEQGAPALDVPLLTAVVEDAVARGELPGCVVAIGTSEGVRTLRAFGKRSLDPVEPMTQDTLFDLASVTKAVATTTSLMRLWEEGKLDLDAPVARYLPAFAQRGKGKVRVRHLLTHTSGLPRVNHLRAYDDGREKALERIYALPLAHPVGQVFNYSDLGFIVLGELVRELSGKPLDQYAAEHVFAKLGMERTRFHPPASEVPRTAPTEERDDETIRGVVDDPRSYRMGGVAGNAGLFSDAHDLSRFARMLLRGGELDGVQLLEPETIERFTTPVKAGHAMRALGWDADSGYAKGRGERMGPRTFGHSGYTGTSLWIDPDADVFVLLLSNRVHVGPHGTIYPLASSVADLALDALAEERAPRRTASVQTGIDVLEAQGFAPLRGRRVVLLTNGAARNREGKRTLDVMRQAKDVQLAALWTPEHGLSARREGHVKGGRKGRLFIHSLFGKHREPTRRMLHGADAIVVDLQDAGARFYTYGATLDRVLRFADAEGVPVWVLDRPNPLGGRDVRGPLTEDAFESFVNYHPLPIQHGLTLGELGRLLAADHGLSRAPHVVQLEGWTRDMRFGDTGLAWHAPSPNLRTLQQVTLYPAVALVEGTNVSVGRGTSAPFELIGAPFVDAEALTRRLREARLPGIRVEPAHFRPRSARHRGKLCHGVRVSLEDPDAFEPVRTGLALARALMPLRPAWDDSRLGRMIAHQKTLEQLEGDTDLDTLMAAFEADESDFDARRKDVLLYPAQATPRAEKLAQATPEESERSSER